MADDSYFPEVEELDRLTREIKAMKADIVGLIDENKKLRAMVIKIVFSTLWCQILIFSIFQFFPNVFSWGCR